MGVTLRKKVLRKGRISLYIDYCYQSKRKKQYLGIILERPDSSEIRKDNQRKMLLAQRIRAKKELEFLASIYEFNAPGDDFKEMLNDKTNISLDFFHLMKEFLNQYSKKDKKMVAATLSHLHQFHKKKKLPIEQITKNFCIHFMEHLRSRLKGNTPVGYFKKFRMCIEKCIEEGYMKSNPTKGIKLIQYDEVTKQILTTEEIQKLALTPCKNKDVKYAFLFSCYSGLRWCDIKNLKFQDIDFQAKRITITQQKVQTHSQKAILHLNLNKTAIKLLQQSKNNASTYVFHLPSYTYMLRILQEWSKKALIQKHITFHCARHTFITHIMSNGANIKTAASLAGHSTTKHTEKYIHIIDELKQKAVDSLPDIDINF